MSGPFSIPTLTDEAFSRGIAELAGRDPALSGVVSRWGHPPFWTHPSGFPGIVIAILAQQVSLESAQAAFARLEAGLGVIEPERFLSLDDATLRAMGFSRQKASYVRGVAHTIIAGDLNLADLESMDNDEARNKLTRLRGIGQWTADAYLLFALRRQDAWPSGDLALIRAVQTLRGLATTPDSDEVDRIADDWRPWRAVAARILWHHYLSERGRIASV